MINLNKIYLINNQMNFYLNFDLTKILYYLFNLINSEMNICRNF